MFLDIHIDPMKVSQVKQRYQMVNWYAENFVNNACDHETLDEYAEQAAADLKDPRIKLEVKSAVRCIQRRAA
jgi:hypothetical protein